MMLNSLNQTNFPQSPIECFKLKIVSLYFVIVLISSFLFNVALLIIFWRFKYTYKENNMFMISLTILNTFGCISELPFVIVSNFNCR